MAEEYKTARQDLARFVAQITSGVKDAIPEQDDFDLADELIALAEKRIKERC